MYAVMCAAEHFRVFLLGRPFLVLTNNMAHFNLHRRDLPTTTRVKRLILRLSEYVLKIAYQQIRANFIADVLYRLPFAQGAKEATPKSSDILGVTSGPSFRQAPLTDAKAQKIRSLIGTQTCSPATTAAATDEMTIVQRYSYEDYRNRSLCSRHRLRFVTLSAT